MHPLVGVTVAGVLLVAGCGTTAPTSGAGPTPVGTVVLKALCPLVHTAYDGLVASSPPSQSGFVDQLERMWTESDNDARAALAPLIEAAHGLVEAGRSEAFPGASDAVYAAIVTLSDRCAAEGRPILHGSH